MSETAGAPMGAAAEGRTAVGMIAAERERQRLRYSPEHDASHSDGSLLEAAALIALSTHESFDVSDVAVAARTCSAEWVAPWLEHAYQKHAADPVHRLVIGAALLAAEIDRLLATPTPPRP